MAALLLLLLLPKLPSSPRLPPLELRAPLKPRGDPYGVPPPPYMLLLPLRSLLAGPYDESLLADDIMTLPPALPGPPPALCSWNSGSGGMGGYPRMPPGTADDDEAADAPPRRLPLSAVSAAASSLMADAFVLRTTLHGQ